MRSLKSVVLVALSLTLVVPMAVTAQEPLVGSSVVPDPTGDLHDIYTMEPLDGPEYMDITQMSVEVSDGDLLLTFDTVGDIPNELSPPTAPGDFVLLGYALLLDTDDDGSGDLQVLISSTDGWTVEMIDLSTTEATQSQLGAADIVANTAAVRVPLAALGDPQDLRFQGLMQAVRLPDESDALASLGLEDRVPDGEDEWLALGQSSTTEVAQEPSAVPAPTPFVAFACPQKDLATVKAPKPGKAPTAKQLKGLVRDVFGESPNIGVMSREYALTSVDNMAKPGKGPAHAREAGPIATSLGLMETFYEHYATTGDRKALQLAKDIIRFSAVKYAGFTEYKWQSSFDANFKQMTRRWMRDRLTSCK